MKLENLAEEDWIWVYLEAISKRNDGTSADLKIVKSLDDLLSSRKLRFIVCYYFDVVENVPDEIWEFLMSKDQFKKEIIKAIYTIEVYSDSSLQNNMI